MRGNVPTVGVFDSGIGGLNVLSACVKIAPEANYLYLGDNGNAPYGERGDEEIYALVLKGVRTLQREGADIIVLACNTATAVAASRLREEMKIPIVGTEPAIAPAARYCKNVLLLATPCTVKSKRLSTLVACHPNCTVHAVGCPTLAKEIEEGNGILSRKRLSALLPQGEYDGVVLGCTHYSYCKKQISAYYRAPVFDGNDGVARRVFALVKDNFQKKQGSVTTFSAEIGGIDHFTKNANICSQNSVIFCDNSQKTVIFFLKKWKDFNKLRYEQMFLFH